MRITKADIRIRFLPGQKVLAEAVNLGPSWPNPETGSEEVDWLRTGSTMVDGWSGQKVNPVDLACEAFRKAHGAAIGSVILDGASGDRISSAEKACAFGDARSAPDGRGGIVAAVDYIDRLLIRVDAEGAISAAIMTFDATHQEMRTEEILYALGTEPVTLPGDARLKPAAAYLGLDADAAATAIAEDFETMVNAELQDFFVKSPDDPRLDDRPLTFHRGSESGLMQAISDAFITQSGYTRWPVHLTVEPVDEIANPEVAMGLIHGGEEGEWPFSASAMPWKDRETAKSLLHRAFKANAGSSRMMDNGYGSMEMNLRISDWVVRRATIDFTIAEPTAHERLEALARIEAATGC